MKTNLPHVSLLTTVCLMIFLTVCNEHSLRAQIKPETPAPMPPDVWSFMHYGNHASNLYTGTVSTSIPIYTYKDQDFELPISLDYASTGFNPNIFVGNLGLGWFLNVGGMISRKVNGSRDDAMTGSQDNTYMDGYYIYHKSSPASYSLGYLDVLSGKYIAPCWAYMPDFMQFQVETAPDEFSFNFLNHKGKFMMGPEGAVDVYSTGSPAGEYNTGFTMRELSVLYDMKNSKYVYVKKKRIEEKLLAECGPTPRIACPGMRRSIIPSESNV